MCQKVWSRAGKGVTFIRCRQQLLYDPSCRTTCLAIQTPNSDRSTLRCKLIVCSAATAPELDYHTDLAGVGTHNVRRRLINPAVLEGCGSPSSPYLFLLFFSLSCALLRELAENHQYVIQWKVSPGCPS